MTKTPNQPQISVVVPTFRRSELLPRALDSLLHQTWPNVQVVVVDDNPPDSASAKATASVLEPYRSHHNFIYIHTSGAVGGGAARNLALKHCTGEYVAFLDDDDRFLPEKLERQITFMLENGLDASYHDVRWVDDHDKLVELRRLDYATDFTTDGLLKTHILHSLCPTATYMIRRSALEKTEGFGEVPSGQDFILMLRCIESGMKIGYLPGDLVIQYLHQGDRISLGDNKIRGENLLYRLKHDYFHLLTRRERSYVRFRHYAVLSFASMRSRRPLRAAGYAVVTVVSSPAACVREGIRYFKSKKGDSQ